MGTVRFPAIANLVALANGTNLTKIMDSAEKPKQNKTMNKTTDKPFVCLHELPTRPKQRKFLHQNLGIKNQKIALHQISHLGMHPSTRSGTKSSGLLCIPIRTATNSTRIFQQLQVRNVALTPIFENVAPNFATLLKILRS